MIFYVLVFIICPFSPRSGKVAARLNIDVPVSRLQGNYLRSLASRGVLEGAVTLRGGSTEPKT